MKVEDGILEVTAAEAGAGAVTGQVGVEGREVAEELAAPSVAEPGSADVVTAEAMGTAPASTEPNVLEPATAPVRASVPAEPVSDASPAEVHATTQARRPRGSI